MRRDDKSLDHLRFEHIALPYRAKKGKCITQMAYAKAVIITPEMEYDTYPTFFQGEAQCVDALFRNGLEYLHLRKPEADARVYETFLKQVEPHQARVRTVPLGGYVAQGKGGGNHRRQSGCPRRNVGGASPARAELGIRRRGVLRGCVESVH